MIFPDFDPVLIQIGPLAIRWYALAYVAGILLGWRYAVLLARNEALWRPRTPPVSTAQIDDLVLWVAIGIIAGGRLGYLLFYQPSILGQLFTGDTLGERLQLFALWTGGMSFHGGLLGVTLAMLFFARSNRINLLSLADLVAPCVPIGLFFGRVANFVNGELWGRPTDLPWGVTFCNDTIRAAYNHCPAGEIPRHPSQLYEAALEGVVLFLLLRWATHMARALPRPGFTVGLFLLGYGVSRVLMETVREPDSFMPEFLREHLTMGTLLSIPMILGGAWLIWRARRAAPEPAQPA